MAARRDPSIRWRVLRDLTDEPADVVAGERARVATEGWGARLLALQSPTASGAAARTRRSGSRRRTRCCCCSGLDPDSPEALAATERARGRDRGRTDRKPFFGGETETCVNGMTLALGAYFGEARYRLVEQLLERLLGEQLDDGGWNCEAPRRSHVASFNATILVLEGLLGYERSIAADPAIAAAGTRRGVPAGAPAVQLALDRRGDPADWTRFSFPPQWHYDVLRGTSTSARRAEAPDALRRGDRARAASSPRRRPLAAPAHAPGAHALRDGGRRRQAEPVEHAAGTARAALVRGRGVGAARARAAGIASMG